MNKKIYFLLSIIISIAIIIPGCFTSSGTRYYYEGVELRVTYENFNSEIDEIMNVFSNASVEYKYDSNEMLTLEINSIVIDNAAYTTTECYLTLRDEFNRLILEIYHISPNATDEVINNEDEKKNWIKKIDSFYQYDKSLVDSLANNIIDILNSDLGCGRGYWEYSEKYISDE